METIYWIQRLSAVNVLAWVVLIIGIINTIVSLITYSVDHDFEDTLTDSEISCKRARRWFRIAPWIIGVSTMVCVFVPTKTQFYEIYGIGGTIDYIKNNDTAKQLPDKAIKALDAWLDEYTETNKSDNNEQK